MQEHFISVASNQTFFLALCRVGKDWNPYQIKIFVVGDTSNSLSHFMALIHRFGYYFGFQINWDKSTLLPLDPVGSPMSRVAEQIRVVETFPYLGIVVHPKLDNYV